MSNKNRIKEGEKFRAEERNRETNSKINRLLFISLIILFISLVNANALIIGGREEGYYNGTIDEIRIWNITLPPLAIKQHYYSNLYKYGTNRWGFYTNQSNLTLGTYTYYGYAKDIFGNANQTAIRYLTIRALDTIPPTYSNFINNASTITKINGVVKWSITLLDETGLNYYKFAHNQSGIVENVTTEIISGTSAFVDYTLTITLSKGNYICGQFWFNDTSNNINQTDLSCFTVANTAPTTPIVTYPVNGNIYSNIPYINYSSSDADNDLITYAIYINGTLNITSTVNVTDWNGADGYYNLTVSAYDGIASSENSTAVLFTLDSTIPWVSIIYPIDGLNISSNSIDLKVLASESGLTYYWIINGTVNSTTVDSNSTFNASDGYYNLTVFASNGLRNGSDTVYFRLDTIAPSFSNNKTNATSPYNGTDVQINITITDNIEVDYYRLITNDTLDGSWANESIIDASERVVNAIFNYSIKHSSLNKSIFGWQVWANDSAGNINVSNAYTFAIIDITPPIIIEKSPSGTVPVSTISLNVTTNEDAKCRYIPSIEGNLSTNYSNMPYNFSDNNIYHNKTMTLADGYYEFYARCIDRAGNVMTKSENISFTIYVEVITVPVTVAGGGGGGRMEREVEERILLELDAPPSKTIFSGDEIEILIKLKNKGDAILYNITLDSETNAPNVTLSLSKDLFDELDVNEEKQFILKIKSLTKPTAHIGINRYFITINANVVDLGYKTSIRFFIEVRERDYEARMETLKQMEFVKDLFEEHPECLEFSDTIEQAQYSYDISNYNKSISLIDSAIQACRDLIASKEEVVEKPAPKEKVNIVALIIEMIILLVLILFMFYYYKKRRGKIEAKSSLELRFEDLFNKTKEFMRKEDIVEARKGYIDLCSLYKEINVSSLPYSIKLDCYRKILNLHSELSKMIMRYRR